MVSHRSDRGSGLIVAILACALIGSAVMLLSQDLNDRQRIFRLKARIVTLDNMSDAAFAETLAELANDPGFTGMALRAIGQGVIWSRVTPILPDEASVIAEAEFDGWRCVLEARVALDDKGPKVLQWNRYTEPAQGSSRLLRKKSNNRR